MLALHVGCGTTSRERERERKREREGESSPLLPLPSHNAIPWPVVHGNRSGPRRVRGEAAPCIVSCPRDRRTSRHSCQRLAHESFHHIEWKRASFLVYITHVRVGNELYDKAVARGGSFFFLFFAARFLDSLGEEEF